MEHNFSFGPNLLLRLLSDFELNQLFFTHALLILCACWMKIILSPSFEVLEMPDLFLQWLL